MLIRAQFATPQPLQQGFDHIAAYLAAQGRPRQSLCSMELRIPEPLSFEGFIAFNSGYRSILEDWDIPIGNLNPVARTNVAPAAAAPTVPSIYAFTFTAPAFGALANPSFVVAGAGDLRAQGLLAKANIVMEVMSERLHGINVDWPQVTTVNLYTTHSLDNFLEPVLLPQLGPVAVHGVHWYYSRPPIAGLEYEMDLRHVAADYRLA